MPSDPQKTDNSAAGITTKENGERFVAASKRADGTVRKEIKIRPGYTPQEDIATYKNRSAEAWKNRGKAGVPGAEAAEDDEVDARDAAGSASKNAKRREARRKAAAAAGNEGKGEGNGENNHTAPEQTAAEPEPEVTAAKDARKLSKKLRQARELKDKSEKGGALLPEQLEKVIRINELIRQLEALGFDAEGEPKP